MPQVQWKDPSSERNDKDLPPYRTRQKVGMTKSSSSLPTSSNPGRRDNRVRPLRANSLVESDLTTNHIVERDCIAWQTISQHLRLQLEQRRKSDSAIGIDQNSTKIDNDDSVAVIDRSGYFKASSVAIGNKLSQRLPNAGDSTIESADNTTEDLSALKVDVHTVPLEQLVQRFDTDLKNGLTNEMVILHRTAFGQNKLTPSRPPSLLWMLLKELFIGFNGILWIATLFAFLSYVS